MAPRVEPKRTRGRPRSSEGGGVVQALDKGLTLLRALARTERATLTEIALSAGMVPSTAHRMLNTMQRHGITTFEESTQHWMVGVEAFRIGSSFMRRTNLVEASRGVMHDLMEESGETANMAIADDGDVVFINQVETNDPIRAFFRPGTRGHMHASGIGKALLAELSRGEVEAILSRKGLPEFTAKTLTSPEALFANLAETRVRGWSLDDEERALGMRCLAAAIFNEHGEVVAGVSISGPVVRLPDARLAELGARVRRAAVAITEKIGGVPPVRGAS
jgi:IclR family acetate operon transcriptional repressor